MSVYVFSETGLDPAHLGHIIPPSQLKQTPQQRGKKERNSRAARLLETPSGEPEAPCGMRLFDNQGDPLKLVRALIAGLDLRVQFPIQTWSITFKIN